MIYLNLKYMCIYYKLVLDAKHSTSDDYFRCTQNAYIIATYDKIRIQTFCVLVMSRYKCTEWLVYLRLKFSLISFKDYS